MSLNLEAAPARLIMRVEGREADPTFHFELTLAVA
jgi:hypothetical protein